jgi:hypothetical protein
MLKFPYGAESLTNEWLNRQLNLSGTLSVASVIGFEVDTGDLKSGFFGEVARLKLRYSNASGTEPQTIIIKFPTTDAGAFKIGLQRGYYDRELIFYNEFAQNCGLRVPKFYGGEVDPLTGASALLLEDLSHFRPGIEQRDETKNDANLLVHQLGKFHARFWEDANIEALEWLPSIDSAPERFQRDFLIAWPVISRYVGKAGDDLGEKLGEQIAGHIPSLKKSLAEAPRVFLHADLRKENLFFDDAEQVAVVLDWQHCRLGRAAVDVASYLFGEAHHMEAAEEEGLLHEYHSALTGEGITSYSYEQCLMDYRMAMINRFVNVGSGLSTVDPDSKNGNMAVKYLSECSMAAFIRYAKALNLI